VRIRLHLGCGKRYIDGFVHVDLDDFPHIDYRHDIAELPMFENSSVELIYCCHAFEHLERQQAPQVLREWWRVLEPGGTLRLAVPDFDALIEVYRCTGELSSIIGPLYGRFVAGDVPGGYLYHKHKTAYNFDDLQAMLEAAGFTNVHRYDWRQTIHRDYDDYSQAYFPHMDKENGLLISLNVEATKDGGAKAA